MLSIFLKKQTLTAFDANILLSTATKNTLTKKGNKFINYNLTFLEKYFSFSDLFHIDETFLCIFEHELDLTKFIPLFDNLKNKEHMRSSAFNAFWHCSTEYLNGVENYPLIEKYKKELFFTLLEEQDNERLLNIEKIFGFKDISVKEYIQLASSSKGMLPSIAHLYINPDWKDTIEEIFYKNNEFEISIEDIKLEAKKLMIKNAINTF